MVLKEVSTKNRDIRIVAGGKSSRARPQDEEAVAAGDCTVVSTTEWAQVGIRYRGGWQDSPPFEELRSPGTLAIMTHFFV